MGCSASTASLALNHSSGGSGAAPLNRKTSTTHQRLSRFLSYRHTNTQSPLTRPYDNKTKKSPLINRVETREIEGKTRSSSSPQSHSPNLVRKTNTEDETGSLVSVSEEEPSTHESSSKLLAKTSIRVTPSSRLL